VSAGADHRSPLDERYELEDGSIFLTGLQAVLRGLLDQRRADATQGLRTAGFVSGYPGSPVAGFDKELIRQRRRLEELDVRHVPGVNEELAATAIAGSQLANSLPSETARYDGVLGLWYGKSPGLDRATDAIRHANFMGVGPTGGVVALVGDDPGAKSSSIPSASETLLAAALVPTLAPGTVQEVLDYTRHGFRLSRASGLWCGLKLVADVADAVGTAHVGREADDGELPTLDGNAGLYRHQVTGRLLTPWTLALERDLHAVRLELARRYAAAHELNRITLEPARPRLGLMAAGKAYHELRDALGLLGLDDRELASAGVRILQMGLLFPLEPAIVQRFAEGLDEIIVVEEKQEFLESAVRDALYGGPSQPRVIGKRDAHGAPLLPPHGELTAGHIAAALGRLLAVRLARPDLAEPLRSLEGRDARPAPAAPARVPFYCSGCPHNRSTQSDPETLVGAGTGCHAMVFMMDGRVVGDILGMTQMGGEGALWVGLEPFIERRHMVQNLGDGTFFHSGQLAVRFAVASKANITFKVLFNRTVAMTGGQDAQGAVDIPELTRMLHAEGVSRIVVTAEDPHRYKRATLASGTEVRRRERLAETERELREVPGVTVLIHDQQCAAEKRRLRKRGRLPAAPRRVVINERVCEGCGDCGRRSNCISLRPVETEFGRKTQIDQPSCNQDESCLEGDCPSFLVVRPGTRVTPDAAPTPPAVPEPAPRVRADSFTARLVGIGGTGVVTVAQVLGMAAQLDGYAVRGLDQTGLAQKGGPVISDVRLSRDVEEGAGKAVDGSADLLLAFDVVGAAARKALLAADPARTILVLSTSAIPTGPMAVDVAAPTLDANDIGDELEAFALDAVRIDAETIALRLFGHSMQANILALGAAYQAGAIPVSRAALRQAIDVNSVSAADNLAAFEWGRVAVASPGALPAPSNGAAPPLEREAAAMLDGVDADGELRRLLQVRVPDLVAYQSRRYARSYLETIAQIRALEEERLPGRNELAEAAARGLHKLMAYKDESEVARLHLDPALRAQLRERYGADAKVGLQLHPPALRALGLRRKVTLGRWFDPMLVALRFGRRLRGTPLDPFRHAKVRRVERALIREYRDALLNTAGRLTPANHEQAVALAELPDMVRGYEELKLANVARYRKALETASRAIAG
jgi:indolepyruvate ferredoxin oxidoreductase